MARRLQPRRLRPAHGRGWFFHEPVYGISFYLFQCPYNEMVPVLGRIGIHIARCEKEPMGTSIMHEARNGAWHYVIWLEVSTDLRRPDGINTLVHECAHTVLTALIKRGINCDPGHQEPYCYYLGWLTEECLKRLLAR